MTASLPAVILIWLIVWLLKEISNNKSAKIESDTENTTDKNKRVHFIPRYYCNEKQLAMPLELHYCSLLGISGRQDITDFTIETAAIMKLEDKETSNMSEAEIHAATKYLLDRWSYMTSLN